MYPTGADSRFASERLPIFRYSPAQINSLMLRELGATQRETFFAWIESMTPELDNEQGTGVDGYAQFLLDHEAIAGDSTYVFFEVGTEKIIATASVIKKDRTIEADQGGWMLGGVNVRRDLRHHGIGTALMQIVDGDFQRQADLSGKIVPVKLFTNSEFAIRIYARIGYAPFEAPVVQHYAGVGLERQFRKNYRPKDRHINDFDSLNVP